MQRMHKIENWLLTCLLNRWCQRTGPVAMREFAARLIALSLGLSAKGLEVQSVQVFRSGAKAAQAAQDLPKAEVVN